MFSLESVYSLLSTPNHFYRVWIRIYTHAMYGMMTRVYMNIWDSGDVVGRLCKWIGGNVLGFLKTLFRGTRTTCPESCRCGRCINPGKTLQYTRLRVLLLNVNFSPAAVPVDVPGVAESPCTLPPYAYTPRTDVDDNRRKYPSPPPTTLHRVVLLEDIFIVVRVWTHYCHCLSFAVMAAAAFVAVIVAHNPTVL